jgi:DNA end-binding protein Ku
VTPCWTSTNTTAITNGNEDFEKIQIESTHAIVIEKFVDAAEVDQIYYDSPYYLAPDGAVAEETFRVVQWAMREKNKVALSRIVLSSRERLIALTVRDKGLMVMTLRNADEVRDAAAYFTDIQEEQPEKEMLDLASALIEQKSGSFDPSEFKDRYQDAVVEMVKSKVKGQEPVIAKAPERGQVINLMDALRQSLDTDRKPPAQSRTRKAAAKPAAKETKPAKPAASARKRRSSAA